MKKVAGKLKLQMAQFRELAAFAQFSSDLDSETKQQIARGERITEVMKQPQFSPIPVEEQVVILYAANNGYLDGYEIADIKDTEQEIIKKAKIGIKEVLNNISNTGELTENDEKKLVTFLEKNTARAKEANVEKGTDKEKAPPEEGEPIAAAEH